MRRLTIFTPTFVFAAACGRGPAKHHAGPSGGSAPPESGGHARSDHSPGVDFLPPQ